MKMPRRSLLRKVVLGERARTSAAPGLSGLLGYQALVGDGVALMRDRAGKDEEGGALLAGWWYRGPDIESASPEALVSLSQTVNNALKRLDTGWMLHVEAVRLSAHVYKRGEFAEAVDALIDEERDSNALHYLTECALFLTFAPPALERPLGRKLQRWFTGVTADEALETLEARIARFEAKLGEVEAALSGALTLHRMRSHADNDELLQALNLIVNGRWQRCRSPRKPVDLACLLARDLVWSATETVHGDDHVEVVGVLDLPPASQPALLHALTQIDTELRWSSRFILQDYGGARANLKKLEAKWTHKVVPLTSQVFGFAGHEDLDAADRVAEVQSALADLESGVIRYGHYTPVVVVRGQTAAEARDKASRVVAVLEERSFMARVETYNRLEAWLGSLPGHGSQNVRQPLIHTLNLADMLPIGREWEGSPTCPSPMFPPGSPALLQGRSWSGSPYYLNLHHGDVGHTLVLGTTGSGKSAFVATIDSQWMRYEDAQVFAFDQGSSMAALALAHTRGGAFYRLGGPGAPQLCPLAAIDADADQAWAAEWLEGLCEAQGVVLTTAMRTRLFDAVRELAACSEDADDHAAARTLTHLVPHLVDRQLVGALEYYTRGPGARVLNGASDAIAYAPFTVFELEELLECGDKVVVPTLLYLFRQVEKRLDGRKTLISLDEAWRYFASPVFAERLRSWLKKLRKRNAAVVLATQQLSDIAGSPIGDVVFESCPTRILLPNENATQSMRSLYAEALNLSAAQIELLSQIERKRWYLHVVGGRSRVFTLDMGPVARAFCGASSPEELSALWRLYAEHGDDWPAAWLRERGLDGAAESFESLELEGAQREVAAIRQRARRAQKAS